MMALAFGRPGEEFEVAELKGGRGFIRRLSEMGIYPGVKLSIVSNQGFGPIILAVNSTRIAIGRGMAMKIIVKPLKTKEEIP